MKRKNPDPLVGQMTFERCSYNACRSQTANMSDWRFGDPSRAENERSLFVTGFVLDLIGHVEDASQNGNVPPEWLQLGGWAVEYEAESSEDPPDALWRTLVADRGPEGSNAKEYYRKACQYAVQHSTANAGLQTTDLKHRGHPILVEFLQRMEAVVWNRRLFKSEREGSLGLAPKRAKEGDSKTH